MSKKTTTEYGRSPRSYGPADQLVYAVIPAPLATKAERYEVARVSNDVKLALITALDDDPNKPEQTFDPDTGKGWRWLSVDEARQLLSTDPNWRVSEPTD